MLYFVSISGLILFLGFLALIPWIADKTVNLGRGKREQQQKIVNELITYAKLNNNGIPIDTVCDSFKDKGFVFNPTSINCNSGLNNV